jgi:hypothetical protein
MNEIKFNLEKTPTNKTKCNYCKQPLNKGSLRLKITAYTFKNSINNYYHYECFISKLEEVIDIAHDKYVKTPIKCECKHNAKLVKPLYANKPLKKAKK